MTRATRPGSVQAAVAASIRAAGGVEAVASDLGLALSTVSYMTERREDRPGGAGVVHLDNLSRIVPEAAVPLAQHFAALAGGVFQPVAPAGAACVSALTREFSDVLGQHAQAMADGSYSRDEAARQVVELDQLIAAAAALRAALLVAGGTA